MTLPTETPATAVVPTGYDPGSYSCVRSLARRGVRTVVASQNDDVPAAASRFCDESVVIPPPEDVDAYAEALLACARQPGVQTILPLRPQDPYVFAKHSDAFADHVSVVTPDETLLETVFDRVQLFEAARAAGVPVPETRRLGEATEWSRDAVVKSRYNLLTADYVEDYDPTRAATVKTVEHAPAGATLDEAAICQRMGHEPIVQEFVESAGEYVFGALYDHGDPVATFQHEQLRGDSYTGGGGVYRRSISNPDLAAVGRQLLDHLNWHGLACIEYVEDSATGEFKLVELNPRLWQSLPCAVRAGADFPAYYWHQATGQGEKIDPEYRVGVSTHLLYGELGYLQSLNRDDSPFHDRPALSGELFSVVSSCLSSPHFDNLRFDDPRPFLRGLRHVLTG